MRKLSLLPFFFIQLFAEGGGTGEGGAGQTAAAPAQPQTGAKDAPLSEVHYGKPESAPAAVGQPANDRSAAFEALIKGEYKGEYEARIKDTISKRLKGTEETVAKYQKAEPILSTLAQKYGVTEGDIEALGKAIEDDESFYEDEALEKGITVQQVKEMRKMQRENAAMKAQLEQQKTREEGEAILAGWMQQAEQVKQIYPAFDLREELQNEQFRNLLSSNVPVQTAFEVIHRDEILPAAMQYTAKQVEAKVANNVRAGKARPAEGAMGSQSAAVYKSDVSQLTDADLVEINRRVMRGEKIRF